MSYHTVLHEIIRDLTSQISTRTVQLLRYIYENRDGLLRSILEREDISMDSLVQNLADTRFNEPSEIELLTRSLQTTHIKENLLSLTRHIFQLLVDIGHPELIPYTALFAYFVSKTGATVHFSNIYLKLETGFLTEFMRVSGDSSGTSQRAFSELKYYLTDISQLANVTGLARLFRDLYYMLGASDRKKLCQELGLNSLLLISLMNPTINNKVKAQLFYCLRSPGLQPYPLIHIIQAGMASTLDVRAELLNIQQMVSYIPKIQSQLADEIDTLDPMIVDSHSTQELASQKQLISNIESQLKNYQSQIDCISTIFQQIINELVYTS